MEPPTSSELIATARDFGRPLPSADDLDLLLDRIGDARFVLLGEASHGTLEYHVPTVLPKRYDAFLYLDEAHALRPPTVTADDRREVPETYPSGV